MPNRPTIIDVARHAGVSKSTVSRVLQGSSAAVKDETRQTVMDAIDAIGYEHNAIASSLRTDRTNMILLAIPDITNPFWPEVARGLQDAVEGAGYSVVFANSDWDPQREDAFLRMARRNRFDALAINPTGVSVKTLLASRMPTVIIGLRNDYPGFDMVGSDSYGGTLQALEHLYDLGHRRIGLIQGRQDRERGFARYNGYVEFSQNHGLNLDPALIVVRPFDLVGGRQAAQALLALEHPPTAIFAANDILAIGAMQAAHEAGLHIPRDLSIIGMDDIYSAATTMPALTTLAKAKYEIGRQAANFLLDRLDNRVPVAPRRQVISCQLIERGSTGPPRAV